MKFVFSIIFDFSISFIIAAILSFPVWVFWNNCDYKHTVMAITIGIFIVGLVIDFFNYVEKDGFHQDTDIRPPW